MSKKIYKKFDKEFAEKFDEKVKSSENIAITGHISPDDDSISSVLAVYYYLVEYLGVGSEDIEMIYTGKKNDRWEYFKNYKNVKFVDDLAEHLGGVDLLVLLDASSWYRFTRQEDFEFDGYTICIDHHPNPQDEFDLHMLLLNYVSCAEIIYKLFYEDKNIKKRIAEILFMGVWGDTGGLRFVRPDNLSAFDTVKHLVETGEINIQVLESKYQKISFDTFRLVSCLLENTKIQKIERWPGFQYSYITRKQLKKIRGDSDNVESYYRIYLDQYMRMVRGADWGFVITPKNDGNCGISLRSLPDSVNVRAIAEQLDGGGHDRAAGGTIKEEDPKKALKKVLDWMKESEPVIS